MKYSYLNKAFNKEEIIEINKLINQNLSNGKDFPAEKATKTSQVKFVKWVDVRNKLWKLADFALDSNENIFGYDLYHVTSHKWCHYNVYNKKTEYSWHTDSTNQPTCDMKLTCLINLSEKKYKGGEFCIFDSGEKHIKEFDEPGSILVFQSFTHHKVKPVLKGTRISFTLWLNGPKFR
jgi:predicted 2-oxoglutarate/Fe(II)-dependent dioxygenase YbiX